jgi:hypothetical protein
MQIIAIHSNRLKQWMVVADRSIHCLDLLKENIYIIFIILDHVLGLNERNSLMFPPLFTSVSQLF